MTTGDDHDQPPAATSSERFVAGLERAAEQHRRRRRTLRRIVLSGVVALAVAAVALIAVDRHFRSLKPTPANLVVFGHSRLFAAAPGSLHILLTDRSGKQPLTGVPVTVELHRGDEVVELARATTDLSGVAGTQFRMPDWADASCQLHVRAQTLTGGEHVSTTIDLKAPQNPPKLMLTTDKPVYQPGQAIEVRALALRSLDMHPVVGEVAVFSLRDPAGTVVFKHEAKTSRFGIAATRCPLGKQIEEGVYTLDCKLGNTASHLGVEVRKYPEPKFRLDVRPDRPFYAPNDPAKLRIDARSFSGKPVAAAPVEVEMLLNPSAKKALPPMSTRTDDKGQVTVECKIPERAPGPQPESDARVTFRVTVTDATGGRQTESVERIVTTQPVRIEVVPEAKTLAPGVRNRVYLFVVAADGNPVQATLTIEGFQGEVKTDEHGLAAVAFDAAGRSMLIVTAMDAAGKQLAHRSIILDSGPRSGDFLLRTDRNVYDPGSRLTLTALSTGSEPVFVEFVKDGELLRTDAITMNGSKGEVTFDLPPGLSGTIEVRGIRFYGAGHVQSRTRLVYIHPPRDLIVRTALDADVYRPGSKATVTFALTDAAGKHAPGAISVAAVDAAVFALLPQRFGDERHFFSVDEKLRQQSRTILPWSPDEDDSHLEETVFATGSAEGPWDFKTMSSWSDKDHAIHDIKYRAAKQVEMGWIVLPFAALLLGYLSMWFFARWNTSIIITVVLILLLSGLFVVKSLGPADPPAEKERAFTPIEPLAEAPQVRRYFPETRLWKAELVTDDQGRARLEIPLADSAGTWLLCASAVTADGRLGAGHAIIMVRDDPPRR
jgi:hypothetical protein